ncbi:Domain of unknown function (DUF4419)-containing protein [uncultured virus]|nr:Domain of unknown function (DUF4419)-containing protein [uncultured virus]
MVDALTYCNLARKKKGKLLTNTEPNNSTRANLSNSFVGAIYDAYSYHYNLVLRPDDVWLTIVIALADYIDNHAEKMRKAFVTFEGKKQLVVQVMKSDWPTIIAQFSDLINENTVGSVRDWIEPKFSTTTPNDSLIGRVALMGAMKNYFAYGCHICCGIPKVTLMGTLEDWQELKHRIERLADYGKDTDQEALIWWRDILIPIADEFIISYEGNPNEDFWQSCANYLGGGSGPSYVSGWVLAFAPFDKGQWRLPHPDDIKVTKKYGQVETSDFKTSATVEVPLKVNDNGREYDAYFYAGGIVNCYDEITNTINPSFDFAMFEMPEGTVKDEIDWVDPVVKSVVKKPVAKPEVSMMTGRTDIVNIKEHGHALKLFTYTRNHQCDVCGTGDLMVGYRCRDGCDYDCCFKCYDSITKNLCVAF